MKLLKKIRNIHKKVTKTGLKGTRQAVGGTMGVNKKVMSKFKPPVI